MRQLVMPVFEGYTPREIAVSKVDRFGSESGLMAIAGWTGTDILVHYTRPRAGERTAVEARRLDLDNL